MRRKESTDASKGALKLGAFKVLHTFVPEEKDVERYICLDIKTIYLNTAANQDAKIVRLI